MNDTWSVVPLSELLKPISRPEPINPTKMYRILGAHWYAHGLYVKDIKSGSQIQADKVYRVEQGDFVYNRLFAWKGSFAVATADQHDDYVSNEFPCFIVNQELANSQYLWRYFSRISAWEEALGLSTGGTPTSRNRLKEEKLLAMQIPLPPLEEQRRIVARVEELAAKIEEARGLRREAVEEVGTLIPQTMTTVVNHDQWTKALLGNLLRENSLNGFPLRPSDTPQGLSILRISAATSRTDAIVDEADFKYIEVSELDAAKYKVEPGDLLACRFNGNSHYVGRFALYKGYSNRLQIYPDKLIRFRVDTKKILPEFTCYMMNSPVIRASVEAFCATTAGNIGISATDLKTIPIPVPPLPEQRRIVAYLDDLQARVDALKLLQAETQAELDSLLPSILDKAFKGELV